MDRPASVAHNDDHRLEERHFVEDFSLYFEQMGYPRMAGRILGWLLICDPPVQSAGELADVLGASKGSLSTMTRLLIQVGLIERAGVPGRRRDYFRIKPGAWPQLIKVQMQSMTGLHQMVERGLAMLALRTTAKVAIRNRRNVCRRRTTCTPSWSASCRRCCNGGRRSARRAMISSFAITERGCRRYTQINADTFLHLP